MKRGHRAGDRRGFLAAAGALVLTPPFLRVVTASCVAECHERRIRRRHQVSPRLDERHIDDVFADEPDLQLVRSNQVADQ
jgi:hypothetical protein